MPISTYFKLKLIYTYMKVQMVFSQNPHRRKAFRGIHFAEFNLKNFSLRRKLNFAENQCEKMPFRRKYNLFKVISIRDMALYIFLSLPAISAFNCESKKIKIKTHTHNRDFFFFFIFKLNNYIDFL